MRALMRGAHLPALDDTTGHIMGIADGPSEVHKVRDEAETASQSKRSAALTCQKRQLSFFHS